MTRDIQGHDMMYEPEEHTIQELYDLAVELQLDVAKNRDDADLQAKIDAVVDHIDSLRG